MGLPDGHPEKDGVMVDLKDLGSEVRSRLRKKADDVVGPVAESANGLSIAESDRAPETRDGGV